MFSSSDEEVLRLDEEPVVDHLTLLVSSAGRDQISIRRTDRAAISQTFPAGHAQPDIQLDLGYQTVGLVWSMLNVRYRSDRL